MGEKIILGYKKGALNNSYLASLYLDIFRLFRSCAALHFRANRIVMPLLSYRTRFCYFLCFLEIHNVYVTALPPHGGKTMKKNYEKNYKKNYVGWVESREPWQKSFLLVLICITKICNSHIHHSQSFMLYVQLQINHAMMHL